MRKFNVTYDTTAKIVTVPVNEEDLGWFLASIDRKDYKVLAVEKINF